MRIERPLTPIDELALPIVLDHRRREDVAVPDPVGRGREVHRNRCSQDEAFASVGIIGIDPPDTSLEPIGDPHLAVDLRHAVEPFAVFEGDLAGDRAGLGVQLQQPLRLGLRYRETTVPPADADTLARRQRYTVLDAAVFR